MLVKTIKYVNPFNNEEEEQSFYFHLTKMEIIEINLLDDLQAVAASTDPKRIIPTLKRIVKAAVGQKIGEKFVKSEEFSDAFVASDAYSEMFMAMLGADDAAEQMAAFVKGLIPVGLEPQDHLEKQG